MLHFSFSELMEMEIEELLEWHSEAVAIVKAENAS
ncbi:GpE family phage tail protein [Cloacibacillus porcorum]|nr:GpE family phage tail protein [Cloacibacillus porcorum]